MFLNSQNNNNGLHTIEQQSLELYILGQQKWMKCTWQPLRSNKYLGELKQLEKLQLKHSSTHTTCGPTLDTIIPAHTHIYTQ